MLLFHKAHHALQGGLRLEKKRDNVLFLSFPHRNRDSGGLFRHCFIDYDCPRQTQKRQSELGDNGMRLKRRWGRRHDTPVVSFSDQLIRR